MLAEVGQEPTVMEFGTDEGGIMGGGPVLVLLIGAIFGAPPFFLLFYAIYEQQKAVGIFGMCVSLLAFILAILILFVIFISR